MWRYSHSGRITSPAHFYLLRLRPDTLNKFDDAITCDFPVPWDLAPPYSITRDRNYIFSQVVLIQDAINSSFISGTLQYKAQLYSNEIDSSTSPGCSLDTFNLKSSQFTSPYKQFPLQSCISHLRFVCQLHCGLRYSLARWET